MLANSSPRLRLEKQASAGKLPFLPKASLYERTPIRGRDLEREGSCLSRRGTGILKNCDAGITGMCVGRFTCACLRAGRHSGRQAFNCTTDDAKQFKSSPLRHVAIVGVRGGRIRSCLPAGRQAFKFPHKFHSDGDCFHFTCEEFVECGLAD